MYLVRIASSRSFLKSKFWNSSFFSHFTKFSSLSYWFLAWSVTSHEILFSKKKIVSLRFETDAALFRLSDHVYSNQPQSVSDKTKIWRWFSLKFENQIQHHMLTQTLELPFSFIRDLCSFLKTFGGCHNVH